MATTRDRQRSSSAGGGRVAVVGLPREGAAALVTALTAVGVHHTVTGELAALLELLAMPDVAALVAPQSARDRLPASTRPWSSLSTAVVLVLTSDRPQDAAAALQDGATGVISPDSDVTDAATAVQLALRGQTVLPHALAVALSARLVPPRVTAEERDWLRALAAGETVGRLASASSQTEREVYRRLSALYQRLGGADRTTALLAAHRHGLLADGDRG